MAFACASTTTVWVVQRHFNSVFSLGDLGMVVGDGDQWHASESVHIVPRLGPIMVRIRVKVKVTTRLLPL